VGGGKLVLVEALAAGGLPAVETGAVPTCRKSAFPLGLELEEAAEAD
jgi:hypothetical protein